MKEGVMSDQCEHIRDEIRNLEQLIDSLQTELQTAAGALKQALIFQIKLAQAELAEKAAELKACEATEEPPLADPRVFGSEITQGLAEYELVAGKDTLARVFVGARQPEVLAIAAADFRMKALSLPAGLHFDVSPFASSRLDFATLHVSGPAGFHFDVPARMSGLFTNTSKSLSEQDNVNFYISGDQLARTGTYRFVARFFRNGTPVGTVDLGSRQFNDTKDLRLLIVVDTFPMPVQAWTTVFRALEFLHRNLPVRTGIAPMDSDLSAGLRFFVDPVPFDPDWPAWGPVAERFTAFNQQQAARGKPDRADKVMTVRTQQPGEGPLGGTAQMPGTISGVVLNVTPPGDSYFATIVSQEIGHNFTLGHAQVSQIPTASAFDLLNRKSLSQARNIMFNPVGTSEFCVFSPQDWSSVRQGLMQLSSTGPV
jgi:hypothetical protein